MHKTAAAWALDGEKVRESAGEWERLSRHIYLTVVALALSLDKLSTEAISGLVTVTLLDASPPGAT
jgi:hypothetical protein